MCDDFYEFLGFKEIMDKQKAEREENRKNQTVNNLFNSLNGIQDTDDDE